MTQNETLLNIVKQSMSGTLPIHKIENIAPRIVKGLSEKRKKDIESKLKKWHRMATMFQDDIVLSVDTDYMKEVAKSENELIFEMLKEIEEGLNE